MYLKSFCDISFKIQDWKQGWEFSLSGKKIIVGTKWTTMTLLIEYHVPEKLELENPTLE